jgi:hypothetical protein
MLRNVFIVLVLTALAATIASASPVVPARSHKRAQGLVSHRRTASHVSSARRRLRSGGSVPHSHLEPAVAASSPSHVPVHMRRASLRHLRVLPPSPLKGSFESLARQNERAESEGLERILDEDDLADRIAQKLLIPVPASPYLIVNSSLPENHRYCRPWTAEFLTDMSQAHTAQWHKPVIVSSAVRTVEYQQQLMRTNGNAAAAEGDIVSPHLTGGTVDIAKQGMSRAELVWMRNWLLALQVSGTIDVEEEFRQRCFHITVYKNYIPPPVNPVTAPARRRHPASASQIATRGR